MPSTVHIVHTHYVRGKFAPAEVIIVPIPDGIRTFNDTPSPFPLDREPEPVENHPGAFWSRTVWWSNTGTTAEELAEYLADWHKMPQRDVTIDHREAARA